MLKGIDSLLNPELLLALARMGHGDELALVDRNYPAYSAGCPVTHLDGVSTTEAAAAILQLFPLDDFVSMPVLHMEDGAAPGELLEVHRDLLALAKATEDRPIASQALTREQFYDRARQSHVVVTTGEVRPYGCFLLVKGVVSDEAAASPRPTSR
jgi:L-fucose mutarotase